MVVHPEVVLNGKQGMRATDFADLLIEKKRSGVSDFSPHL
jgi:hypothetical protein